MTNDMRCNILVFFFNFRKQICSGQRQSYTPREASLKKGIGAGTSGSKVPEDDQQPWSEPMWSFNPSWVSSS